MKKTDLHHLSITEAAALIGARKISPVELLDAILARIEAVDGRVHSYIEVLADRARAAARRAEAEIMAGRWRGPLHGVPFGVKDNYHVAGIRTTGGSRLMTGSPLQTVTSTIVARLEDAGAILVGKLNTWEYGTGNGQVYHDLPFPAARNPWDLGHFTGGSSTGAGASVAAGTALFALGSDTGGSIRLPAAACGLQGFKATFGLNSRAGCLPNCWSLDHTGALTWTVEDGAIVLGATAGHDPLDPSSATAPVPDYRKALHAGVKGLVIGIVRDLGPEGETLDPDNRAAMETAADILADAGAIIREIALPAPLSHYRAVSWVINWAESFSIHEEDFMLRRDLMGRALRAKMMTGFCVRAVDYLAALRMRRALARSTDAVIRSVDAMLIPQAFHVAPSFAEPATVPAYTVDTASAVFNLTGHPALSICTGFNAAGLPLNAQIVGRYFDEATVLRVAHAYESATPWRNRRPTLEGDTPEPVMPDITPPSVSPEQLAEAETYAKRYGLSELTPAMLAEFAVLFDRAATAGLAIPRMASKEDEPAHVFRVPAALTGKDAMEPCFLTASEASDLIREGRLTSEALVRSCLERIAERDPAVKAWLYLDPAAAIKAARETDKQPPRSRLHGLPFGVKDMIDTADMPTTYNSANWQGYRPAKDAACVGIVRASGAVILGKTDTVEFAAAGRKAATRHPLNPGHTPGGSSSGSGAAVGDHQVPLAFGTQTGGSHIRPASFNGIYGLKSTWGAVSREGAKVYSNSLDTIGWYGRCVDDLRLVAEAFRVDGVMDEPAADKSAIRVALCRTPYWSKIEPAGEAAFAEAADRLKRGGVTVTELDLPAAFGSLFEAQDTIMFGEGRAAFLDEYLIQGARLGQDFIDRAENSKRITPRALIAAHDLAAACRREFEAMFDAFDVVLAPAATGEAPEGLHTTGDHVFNAMWTLLHVPCLSIPCTFGPTGLPVGIQIVAPRFADARLMAIAEALAPLIDAQTPANLRRAD